MPHVHTWNSQANSHPVEAEFIIMDKVEGVPLSQVWSTMQLQQRLKVIIAMTSLRKKWLSVLFSHNGSLYYAGDVQPLAGNHYIGWYSHQKVRSLLLARSLVETDFMRAEQIWTLTGDHVCQGLYFFFFFAAADQAIGASQTQYLQAVGMREMKSIRSLKPPKQITLFCSLKLY